MDNNTESVLIEHMGSQFYELAPLLQKSHIGHIELRGTAQVERGNLLAKMLCNIMRFPKVSASVPLTVDCQHTKEKMLWRRNFDGLIMASTFCKHHEYLVEYLGPLAMSFKAEAKDRELHYEFYKTRFLGIPMPKLFSPQVIAYEREANGLYQFYVSVSMCGLGKVISYQGKLELKGYH